MISMLWGAKDVAHNDIKPDNMMVSDDGTVSFIDFGSVTFGDGVSSSLGICHPAADYFTTRDWTLFSDGAVCQHFVNSCQHRPGSRLAMAIPLVLQLVALVG